MKEVNNLTNIDSKIQTIGDLLMESDYTYFIQITKEVLFGEESKLKT